MRSVAAAVVLTALVATGSLAQTGPLPAEQATALGDSLMRSFDTPAAIEAYRRGIASGADSAVLTRKLAHALSDRADATGGEAAGALHEEAVRLARRAVRLAPRSARGHSVLAVVLGRHADRLAHQRRLAAAATVVELGREAYRHADRAIALDPDDWVAHGFLGVMHRRLATVHPVVRRIAGVFLDWPDVSLEQSEWHLARSIRIEPDEVTTRLELARTYAAMDRGADARRQAEAALAVAPRDRLDRKNRDAARRLLRELD